MTSSKLLDRITVVIVNYNAGDWLARCIQSLRKPDHPELSIIIIDNGSIDGSLDLLADDEDLVIDRTGTNLGFAGAIERARISIQRDYILILNPDCLITPDGLTGLAEELEAHPEAGLVSGRVVSEDGEDGEYRKEQRGSRRQLPTPQRILAEVWPGQRSKHEGIDLTHTQAPEQSSEMEGVSGACMLIRRSALEAVGGFDTQYPLHFEDLDLFARLGQAGWTIRWCPEVQIMHAGGASSKSRPVAVLWAKHRGLWRYLNQHCRTQWPIWQRPLWAAMLIAHASLKTPLVWFKSVYSDRS